MNPRVSIIVPNYNHERFLRKRIQSVLSQTFQDFEVYILDDCSTDNSMQIIDDFKRHPKIKGVITNNTNSGSVFKQWIKGVQLSKGKYIWIAESDDLAHPDFLKETVEAGEQNTPVGMVFTNSITIDQSGDILKEASPVHQDFSKEHDRIEFKIADRSKVLDYFVSRLIIGNASSVLFSKNALREVDFNILSSFRNAGDLFTYIAIALTHDIIYLNKPLNYFRSHSNNTTKANILSGILFAERQMIMAYYLDELAVLKDSKWHLRSFFNRNFLTAVDFKHYKKVKVLLHAYYKYEVIPSKTYLILSVYICYYKKFKKAPHVYRMYIKKILAK